MNIERQPPMPSKVSSYIKPTMGMGYRMQAEPSVQKPINSDMEGVTLSSNSNMGEEYNMNFNRIFQDGVTPPILTDSKRHRRLSSIVGVKSNPYGRDFVEEEIFEQRNSERYMHDNRKPSLDFNFQYESGHDPNHMDPHRRGNGNYFNYNPGGMGHNMGNRGSMDYRKDSNF